VSPKRLAGTVLLVVGVAPLAVGAARTIGGGDAAAAATATTTATTSIGTAPTDLQAALAAAGPATEPFADLTETHLRVGRRTLRVVLADDDAERVEGLRQRRDLGPYDAMLFVFDEPSTTRFTMSTVPVGLDIGFYRASGGVVDRLHMKPCAGSEAECPVYAASGPFRYALETVAGDLPRGRLRS
jgi:uncharacterized membrane protein (UPF0127 family)